MTALRFTLIDLHAYADRQLDREFAAAIERALEQDPAAAGRVSEIRRQNALLHDLFDDWLNEPIPSQLLATALRARNTRWRRRLLPVVAAAAALVLGIATGWLARDVALQ